MSVSENNIHPTAILEGDIQMGSGNYIGPFCYLKGPIVMGNDNWLGAGTKIGVHPEVRSINHFDVNNQSPGVLIGDDVVIREDSQIHQGWKRQTIVGSRSFIMNQSYIAHDCQLAEEVTLASSSLLAGHVSIEKRANLGMGSVVHQGLTIGPIAMVGMGSVITRDVPAFSKVFGNPARIRGCNVIGLERAGVSKEIIDEVVSLFLSDNDSTTIAMNIKKMIPIAIAVEFGI